MKIVSWILLVFLLSIVQFRIYAQSGLLKLKILDAKLQVKIPARVEIKDTVGTYFIAEDAMLVGGDCDMSDDGAGLVDLESTLQSFTNKIDNPYTKSTQFYSNGESKINLPNGKYFIRIFKGPEFFIFRDTIYVEPNRIISFSGELLRWINMPDKNWYSADDHLHIPRPVKELDPYISKMMQAEDIHVANLLQMGKYANTNISPQYAHGRDSYYQHGNYILAAGQENPRTHFLGHAITLGAQSMINNPEKYLIYRLIWEEGLRQGGINGYAHAHAAIHSNVNAQSGIAVVLPHDLMHFMEVLQFNRSDYGLWYDVLNLGFKVAPTAGTDFPCAGQNIPGHERFYTKVVGEFNYRNWLDGVRRGRTFVTTGPLVEFSINDRDIGSNITLEQTDSIELKGTVFFDPYRDDLKYVEVLQNGEVIKRITRIDGGNTIQFKMKRVVNSTSWYAFRGYGNKIDESIWSSPLHFSVFDAQSVFHTAPIFITVPNTNLAKKQEIAEKWIAVLNDLENMLSLNNIDDLAEKLKIPNFDAIPKEVLLKNRNELLDEIADSREYFSNILDR